LAERAAGGDEVPRGSGIIEVRVRDVWQLFDSMDPSPFLERDLDRDAEEYIVSSARELSSGSPIALVVHLDGRARRGEDARVVEEAIREHFARRAELTRRELRQLLHRGWISLMIGLSFLAAALIGGASVVRSMGAGPLATMLRESLLIGGWVAMWRPMEILLYDWWAIRGTRRVYERLARMPVRIVVAGAPASARRSERASVPASRAPDRRASRESLDPSRFTVRLFDEASGKEIGRISETDLAFLRAVLEEERPDDTDYWINPDTVDLLERRGGSAHVIALLRAATGGDPDGIDVAFQRSGEPRETLWGQSATRLRRGP